MTRLLGANFARLRKNSCFWNCMAFMASYGLFMVCMSYYNLYKYEYKVTLENMCFGYANLMGFVAAVFVSLFLGTEYSDGTIRNKLTIGHKRHEVYMANLIVNGAGVLAVNAVYVGVVLLFEIPFAGFFKLMEPPALLRAALLTVLMDLSYTAVFTLCSMLNQNKAAVTAASILSVLFLVLVSGHIRSRLDEPQVYETYAYVTDAGDTITKEGEVNPYYLEGTKREICTFLNDFLPSSQGLKINDGEVDRAWQMSIYSCLIVIFFTGAGICIFEKKDIR